MRKGFGLGEVIMAVAVLVFVVGVFGIIALGPDKGSKSGSEFDPAAAVAALPEPNGYVMDLAGVLSPGVKDKLEKELTAFDGKAQISVVTVTTTAPFSIEEYSIKLAEKWKPGYKGKDNGVIFITATQDRKIRIEVGTGLEGVFTDAEAGRIIHDVIGPKFHVGDWDGGTIAGVEAIENEVK